MGVMTTAQLRATPLWWRDLSGVACWSTVLVVLALWLHGRGVQGLGSTPGEELTSLGRLTGLVAADLLLVQVVLMARVPLIERSYGQDELARRHRLVGFWSFNLMLLHIALICVGYALTAHLDVLRETWAIVTTYRGMLLATGGTLALVLVTVTSIRAARRSLRYEAWHLLHLYAYVGVGLAVPHQIWTGQDFSTSRLATAYWLFLWVEAAGLVVVFRIAQPLVRTLRHGIRVTSVHREAGGAVTVNMGGRGLGRLPARAGQFFVFRFMDGPGWSRGNPYSLSAAPRLDRLRITAPSERLAGLQPGTRVLIEGPYGRLTGEDRVGRKLVMIAGGIGITPMRALLEDLPYAPGDAVLLYRVSSWDDIVFQAELEELAAARGVAVRYLVGPRGSSWLPAGVTASPRELAPALLESDVFVCGPDAWMTEVERALRAAGLPASQLHEERFTW